MDQISITNSVIERVSTLLTEENDPGLRLRVFVSGGGCSGFQYGFTFDKEQNDDDFEIVKEGVTFLIDAMSMQYLSGATIDFQDDLNGSQFVISNPAASSTCGCGSSFSV